MRWGLVALLILGGCGRDTEGPRLNITSVRLSGRVDSPDVRAVTLAGRGPFDVDEAGRWCGTVPLKQGDNVVVVEDADTGKELTRLVIRRQ